jgi:hypothetical protein
MASSPSASVVPPLPEKLAEDPGVARSRSEHSGTSLAFSKLPLVAHAATRPSADTLVCAIPLA